MHTPNQGELQELLGTSYIVAAPSPSGNVQVNLADLRNMPDHGDRLDLLHQAYHALLDAGYDKGQLTVQFVFQNRNRETVEWPCIWVNKTARASVRDGTEVTQLRKELASLTDTVKQLVALQAAAAGIVVPADTDPAPAEEEAPSEGGEPNPF